jgi:hypothetical protein
VAKQLDRVCESCNKSFKIHACRLKRNSNQGRFCSIPCRALKPNTSELARELGFKPAKAYRQRIAFQKIRLGALRLVSSDTPKCGRCGCDVLEILEINHIHGGGTARKESGIRLWRIVLAAGDSATEFFNVRCKVCNQLEYVEARFNVRSHRVIWGI